MQIIIVLFFSLVGILLAKNISNLNITKVVGIIVAIVSIFITFNTPINSIIILIFSMLLSPEIGVGNIPGRSVVIRYDDILLILIFLTWLFRTAFYKREPFLVKTPVQTPLLIYTSIYIISTFLGILRGNILFTKSFFYVLKYIEYYLMYFMVVNILKDEKDFSKYIKYGFIVLLIVVIYSYYYYFTTSGSMVRTTAPFEAPLGKPEESEPASLGGYYLLVMGIILSFLSETTGKKFIILFLTLIFVFISFLLSFSRASYMGFIAMFFIFLFFVRKRKMMFLFFGFFVFIFSIFTPGIGEKVKKRIESTYKGSQARNIVLTPFGIVKLEDSAYQRYQSIERVILNVLPNYPFLGKGVTGIGLGDNQYSLLLGESGIFGFIAFFWLIVVIISMSYKVYNFSDNIYEKSISFGVFCSIFAFLVQGLGVNTFIIVRIMEPFWFCVAIVSLSYIRMNSKTKY